jgi:hypothetical protein
MESQLTEVNKTSAEVVIATIISYLFHPLLMPTYGFVLLFFTSNSHALFVPLYNKVVIISVTFLFTFILPTLNALILLMMGRIKSLRMQTSSERVIPYTGALLYYFALSYLFYSRQLPLIFSAIILGAAISILLTLIINNRWMISAHAVGTGGTAGVVISLIYKMDMGLDYILVLVILMAGIVGYARLKLNAHSPAQVYSGFLLGAAVEFIALFLIP